MTQPPPKKFVPVMITPFTSQSAIDLYALSELTDFYRSAGVDGFFANCLSSEMFSISETERLELTRHVVDQVNGALPVVATGSFGVTLEERAESTRRVYDTGVDAVIMISSHFALAQESDQVLTDQLQTLLGLTGSIPLGIYECPAPYKRILSPQVFSTLLASGRMVYHKDTSLVPALVKAKLDLLKASGNQNLEFYDAHTPNTLFSLGAGARGMSSISGNFYPEIMSWICHHLGDPSREEDLQWIQSEISRVDPIIHQGYPVSAKYFLQKRGLSLQSLSRSQVYSLSPDQQRDLDQVYVDFLGWCDRLGIPVVRP